MLTKILKDRKWIQIVIGIIVLMILVWFFFMRGSVKIKISQVMVGEITPSISVSGEIDGQKIEMGTKMPLVVSWIGVKEGDAVKKGQLLLKFDNYESAGNDFERMKALYENGFATRQQYEAAKLAYNNSRIVAPISGVVSLVAPKIGETANPGAPVITVVNPSSAYAELQIDESDVGDVTIGKEVILSCDAYPDLELKGKLVSINEAAEIKKTAGYVQPDEEDKVFRAKVMYDDPTERFKIGMSVNAEIIKERKSNVLLVPREAIFEKGGKTEVFMIKYGHARETAIETGLKDFVNVEIIRGLKEKDKVAISEIDKLHNGTRISEIK